MARKQQGIQTSKLDPMSGFLDTRTEPAALKPDAWRILQNFGIKDTQGRLARTAGWKKLLKDNTSDRAYNNEDLHDQLLALQTYYDTIEDVDDSSVLTYPPSADYCGTTLNTRDTGRQPITFLTQVTASNNTRRLLAGTQSRLYAFQQRRGNYQILGDGFGGDASNPGIRWKHATLGDHVILTNDYDDVQHWEIGAQPSGCLQRAIHPIQELIDLGVRKAALTVQYSGVVFIMNLEIDGVRQTNAVRWCKYGDVESWIEDPGFSTAGEEELDPGEVIMAAGTLGQFLYIYTSKGVWQVSPSPDPNEVFNFTNVYRNDKGAGCIQYPNSFVALKDGHFYMSKEAIYGWSPLFTAPDRLEWIHRAAKPIYQNLNKSACNVHNAWFEPSTERAFFSCVQGSDTLPSVTLVVDTQYKHCHVLDYGFTAGTTFIPDNRPTIQDWLIENGVCTEDVLDGAAAAALGWHSVKQGDSVASNITPGESPTCIHTRTPLVTYGVTMEDHTKAESDADSLCALVGDMPIPDACRDCEGTELMIAASATDYCIKQFDNVYYREEYNFTAGTYSQNGYTSKATKVLTLGSSATKAISRVLVNYSAEDQTVPSKLNLRIGAAAKPEDPDSACNLQWNDEGGQNLECIDNDKSIEWLVWAADSCLYVELSITGTG
jgi:hypothetical protein